MSDIGDVGEVPHKQSNEIDMGKKPVTQLKQSANSNKFELGLRLRLRLQS